MTRKKVSELPALGAIVEDDDYLLLLDSSGSASRKLLVSNLVGGWRDLRCPIVGSASGAGTPSLQAFGPTGSIKMLRFGVGDSVYLAAHWNHDIKVGSTVYPHVHWSTDGTSTNTVKWELYLTTAAGFDQANFPADTTITIEEAAAGTAWRHMVSEDGTGFTAPEVDSLTLIELKRVTNGGSENGDQVFGLFVDFHFQAQQYGTPNKAPSFY